MFNLSLPEKHFQTPNYQYISAKVYYEYQRKMRNKRKLHEEKLRQAKEVGEGEQEQPEEEQKQPAEETAEEPQYEERNWYECVLEGPTLIRIEITNKTTITTKVNVQVLLDSEDPAVQANAYLPESGFSTTVFRGDTETAAILTKLDPSKPFGPFKVEIQSKWKSYGSYGGGIQSGSSYYNQGSTSTFLTGES